MPIQTNSPVNRMGFWCQKILPAVYDDSLSYYELLCKVMQKMNEMIELYNAGSTDIEKLFGDVDKLKEDVDFLKGELDRIKAGDYDSELLAAFAKWIDENLVNLVGRVVKFVNFGLSKEGYFYAYIPTSWRFLKFDTGAVYGEPDYGCLILSY